MVFFNCNACGEALKKNQVDKHCQRCRRCEVLSCVDCGKDFWGDEYKNHTKCMTEEEKYCGKANVPKVSKGEAKQEMWIETVQAAISKTPKDSQMSQLLENIKCYPNIPRKFGKFENFLKNSLCVRNTFLINQLWDLLMTTSERNETNPVASVQEKHDNQNADIRKSTDGFCQKMDAEKSHLTKIENRGFCKKSLKRQKKSRSLECQETEDISKPVVCEQEAVIHDTLLEQEQRPRKKKER